MCKTGSSLCLEGKFRFLQGIILVFASIKHELCNEQRQQTKACNEIS